MKTHSRKTLIIAVVGITIAFIFHVALPRPILQKIKGKRSGLKPLTSVTARREVFGFLPYWKLERGSEADFDVLTTLAYFGIPVGSDGHLITDDYGYQSFHSEKATEIFRLSHDHGTRVVLTLTQMDNDSILAFLDNPEAQKTAIDEAVALVGQRGIDGINVDFEFLGDPGAEYRSRYTHFVAWLNEKMHDLVPSSRTTVSVYASSVKEAKLYDVKGLAAAADGIFMMAYDYAATGSDTAMPTAPLFGYKSGKYWYDVSTAVEDFLTQMPADRLILGVPWYGYSYPVLQPQDKADALSYYYSWYGHSVAQTYGIIENDITPQAAGPENYLSGWDNEGKVGWRAVYQPDTGVWRMIYAEDVRSLGQKYDFAKAKNLLGVGIWALGFEEGKPEMWSLLRDKFGQKLADVKILQKPIL